MRLSKLNIKKINMNDIDENYSGQDILLKLGELYQFESGIFGYGNIWNKLQRKVEDIIIEELDKADCIQVDFPRLQPKKIWDQSNRWDVYTKTTDTMYTIDCNFGEYGLSPTAEECATIFGSNRLESYKTMPAVYYQIGEKFRKEIRARGYLFRPRTFTMMDAYSFDRSKEELHKTFNKMHDVYMNIFKRIGIDVISVISDGGTMGGRVSEEFQAITKLGEDIILFDKEKGIGINKEVLDFEDRDIFIKALGIEDLNSLKEVSSVELGNNFELDTKYSDSMKLYYVDENGNNKPYYMGCYGIGLGRICACLIENNVIIKEGKLKGFSLPYSIAPYKVQIIYNEDNKEHGEKLYKELSDNNISCILDDRENINLGSKINDVYVLGTPKIIVLGNKFDGENYTIENAVDNKTEEVPVSEIVNYFQKY